MRPAAVETPCSVLFVDLSDHTRLFAEHGAAEATALVRRCLDLLRAVVVEAGGTIHEEKGDELLCWFEQAEAAIQAASRLHFRMKRAHLEGALPCRVRVRVGVVHGPLLRTEDRLAGATLIAAHRLVERAKADQTLTTAETLERVSASSRAFARAYGVEVLKGLPGEWTLYEVHWDPDVTRLPATDPGTRLRRSGVRSVDLVYGDRTVRVDAQRPQVELGRGEDCDLRVAGDSVSRVHARVRWHGDQVVLEDMSLNGTRVERDDRPGQAPDVVHRREALLAGSGSLRLGDGRRPETTATVRYRCEVEAAGG